MNIAILISSLSGGGAERVAQRIGDYYADRGENVFYFVGDFVLKQDYEVKGKIINTGITELYVTSKYGVLWRRFCFVRNAFRLYRLKKKYRIDVTISFMEMFNHLNALSRADDKVILRVCTVLSERPELTDWIYERERIKRNYSRADKVVAISSYGFRELRDIYEIPEKKLAVVYNSVPLPSADYDNNISWNYGNCPIVFMGRLEYIKQPDRIIRAFRFVAERNSKAELFMIGKGPLDSFLKALCRKYGLENRVIFTGFKKDTEIFLRKAKVFVMASKVEGFGNVIIEAMSYGVPIVATNSPGGISDILQNGEYGILTPQMPREKTDVNAPLSEEEIALGEATLSILDDDKKYEEYHKRSLMRARDFETDKIMTLWDKIIK